MSRPFIATLVYMAPELKHGGYTEMVDVYSFGAVLYEMVTRSIPWSHLLTRGCAFDAVLLGHFTKVRFYAASCHFQQKDGHTDIYLHSCEKA